ncbi:MAG: MBL fold metallo-hydrolase [Kiritimatiellia bacterium]
MAVARCEGVGWAVGRGGECNRLGFCGLMAAGVVLGGCLGVAGEAVRIVPVGYGRFDLPMSWILPGGSGEERYPIVLGFHLLQVGRRLLLADVGCDRFVLEGREAVDFVRPVEALRRLGVEPAAIEACLISHAHEDHIGAIGSFPRARVYIQEDEARAAGRLLEGRLVTTFREGLELFGGRLRMVRVGGHTRGSSVLLAPDCERGKIAVIAGDAVYSRLNLSRRLPTPTTQNPVESRAFIETYCTPRHRIYLCHDFLS